MTTYRAGARASVEELFAKEGDSLDHHGFTEPVYGNDEERALFEERVRHDQLQQVVKVESVPEEV